MIKCAIDGCDKPKRKRDWCVMHYARWMRHGDPLLTLIDRAANGEARKFIDETVLSYEGDECLPWPFGKNGSGYGSFWHDGEMQIVSRVVCEKANGPPPTHEHEAAHSCGKGHLACCTKGHLSWKTHAENMADLIIHGPRNQREAFQTDRAV